MAKLSTLVPALAEVLGLPEPSVALPARRLREARVISTGGRGPGGADMTASDCAALLVAVLASESASAAPAVVQEWRRLQSRFGEGRSRMDAGMAAVLDPSAGFLDQLSSIIDLGRSGVIERMFSHMMAPQIVVHLGMPVRSAFISIHSGNEDGELSVVFMCEYGVMPDEPDDEQSGDLTVSKVITDKTLLRLGLLLRT
ncbi:hypothetical protein [Azospirillum rugosum]|uniref:Uncharacterized protein n=1 Tax=Azospirillum rugosum TaxID=416170 RepID=A0ABS4SQI8_9PROT|nr:hypothetical protein [Azospirillum rugosum]MBP2294717.1 hypothetical protein [Azospirillum rugosum]MDQ0527994.1 hypothetical protein [Azospirillum rugosum]